MVAARAHREMLASGGKNPPSSLISPLSRREQGRAVVLFCNHTIHSLLERGPHINTVACSGDGIWLERGGEDTSNWQAILYLQLPEGSAMFEISPPVDYIKLSTNTYHFKSSTLCLQSHQERFFLSLLPPNPGLPLSRSTLCWSSLLSFSSLFLCRLS